MKKCLLLFCLVTQTVLAQIREIDSLKRCLAVAKQRPARAAADSMVYRYLDELMRAYAAVQVDSALLYNTRLTQLLERRHDEGALIDAHMFAGYLFLLKGANYESVSRLYKALVIAEKRNNINKTTAIYSQLAHAYLTLKDYKKTRFFCEKGLGLVKRYPDTNTQMEILNIYGAYFQENGQYKQALDQYLLCNKLSIVNKDAWYEAQSLIEIGWANQDLKQFDKAIVYYRKALQLAQKTNNYDVADNSLISLTSLLIKQKKWSEALQYSKLVEKRSLETKNAAYLLNIRQKQYLIYKNMDRSAAALAVFEKYINLKDSLSRETNETRIANLQAQYDNVQKENKLKKQQVQLLSEKNKSQQLAQTRNGLFAGIFGVIAVAALLLWNNQRLQRKNEQISKQSTLLEKAKTELAELNQSLEIRVQARTQDLLEANAELIRKNDEIRGALFKG